METVTYFSEIFAWKLWWPIEIHLQIAAFLVSFIHLFNNIYSGMYVMCTHRNEQNRPGSCFPKASLLSKVLKKSRARDSERWKQPSNHIPRVSWHPEITPRSNIGGALAWNHCPQTASWSGYWMLQWSNQHTDLYFPNRSQKMWGEERISTILRRGHF